MTGEIKQEKPIWRKWWFWIIAIFVIIIIASGKGEKKETKPEVIQPSQQEITQPPQKEIQPASEVEKEENKEGIQKLPIQKRLNYEIVVSYQDLLIGKNIYVKPPYSEQDLTEFLQYWKELTKQYKREKVIGIWLFSDRSEARDFGKNIQTGAVNISKILGSYTSNPEYGNSILIQRNNKTVTITEERY